MLEGSFRPPCSTTTLHHPYAISKAVYTDQAPSVASMRRKDHTGPAFTPIHDRPGSSSHSPDYESEDHLQSESPSSHSPRYLKKTIHNSHSSSTQGSMPTHSPGNSSSAHPTNSDSQSPSVFKMDLKIPHEALPKNSSIGPVRAKKKPAGSACNSCHRLKTRCSGGHPCDRCAAHKVPCQFDRDLIYRSPLASSSQQASARNTHTTSKPDPLVPPKPRSRGGAKAGRKAAAAAAAAAATLPAPPPPPISQSIPPASILPITPSQSAQLSPPPVPVVPALPSSITHQNSSCTSAPFTKPPAKPNHVAKPVPSEAFIVYETANVPQPNGLHVRLAALENSVSGLLQVLRSHQPHASHLALSASEQRAPLSPPMPPTLMVSGSSSTFGPEKDQAGDSNRLGSRNPSCVIGDPLSEGILPTAQLQYLYDVFVEFCLPSLPILHAVQIALIRSRSSFLFTVMVSIGARFCSSQSLTHLPTCQGFMSTSTGNRIDLSQVTIDESTYNRLVALSHQHLSATLLKSSHTLEDVRAILFLACWALVSSEESTGAPNRWVLIGHAGRIARSIGLDRCASELQGCIGIWNNPDIHEARREQLDAIKTDEALRAIETILSSNLRLEPSRGYFPPLQMPNKREASHSLVQLSTGSPSQYDIISAAQIEALAELTEIWFAANSFLSVADDRSRSLSSEQLIELGERHNQAMDAWAKKWTWHGSSWAPLLGANLRTIKLLSESLRISLNLAFTNVLYAIGALNRPPPPRFHEILAMALERVNGSSTAVIQAHRDSVREGFSLAFAPDLVTDGLVSAAITVLQLASPVAFAPMFNKPGSKDGNKVGSNNNGNYSNTEGSAEDDRISTPEDKTDVGMSESKATLPHGVNHVHSNQSFKGTPHESRMSSPSSTPRRLSKCSSPRMANISFFSDLTNGSSPTMGKKCFMEAPVAAHYIRMATDVLQTSDRSQTRLGTIMAGKIIKLATQAGLMGPHNVSNRNPGTGSNSSSAVVSREGRPSISSTSSISSSTKPARLPSADHTERASHSSRLSVANMMNGSRPNSSEGPRDALSQERPASAAGNHGDSPNRRNSKTSQELFHHTAAGIQDPPVDEDDVEDDEEAEEDDIEDDGGYDEVEQMGDNSNLDWQSVDDDDQEKKLTDMMDEDL